METLRIISYEMVLEVLGRDTDVAVFQATNAGGNYCNIMTLSEDIAGRISSEFGWEGVVSPIGRYICLHAPGKSAPEVISALESLAP